MKCPDAAVQVVKVTVFTLLCSLTGWAQSSRPVKTFGKVTVLDMKKGDSLTVRYGTTGCFHSASYELSIRRAKEGLLLTGIDHSRAYNEKTKSWVKDRNVKLKQVKLTDEQVQDLEKAFIFYRSISAGGCTTVDEITFTQQRNDKVLARERFIDATCGTYERKDLLDTGRLAALLIPEGS